MNQVQVPPFEPKLCQDGATASRNPLVALGGPWGAVGGHGGPWGPTSSKFEIFDFSLLLVKGLAEDKPRKLDVQARGAITILTKFAYIIQV